MNNNAMTYRTGRAELLDAVCFAHYGNRPKAVEAVLDANPGLARHGPVLPEGLDITLPDLGPAAEAPRVTLWG